jgi:two-component system phosphate regulon sensor histidine kinase PhoR
MVGRSIRLKLTLANVTLALISIVAIGLLGLLLQQQAYRTGLRERMRIEGALIADELLEATERGGALAPAVARLADITGTRVTVISMEGQVLADSAGQPEQMENHAERPEVAAALAGQRGETERTSTTTGQGSYYIALPIGAGPRQVGVVRLAVPLTEIERALRQTAAVVASVTILCASVAALLTFAVTQRLTGPLRDLTALVQRVAAGRFTDRLPVRTDDELGHLARSVNQMAGDLDRMVGALASQRDEVAAILNTVSDGILIVDRDQRIRRINQTALTMFETTVARALDRPLIEVAPDHDLAGLVGAGLDTGQPQRQVIERSIAPHALSVIVTPIASGELDGALVTLHDVSELRRLEQVRRQFVANVSHELRTPLANIRLMVETLQEDPTDLALTATFLTRINEEVDSLTQMVREILELSRLESGQAPLDLAWQPLDRLITQTIDRLAPQAQRQGVALTADASIAGLPAVVADRERLAGVLTNLLHNAIKFTLPGGAITVGGEADAAEVRVWVRDTGVGIPPEALPHVFERFYKVDKARTSGGSGLGLAIVKHTIQAHGGRTWAESTPGQGSTFSFSLPRQAAPALAARI